VRANIHKSTYESLGAVESVSRVHQTFSQRPDSIDR